MNCEIFVYLEILGYQLSHIGDIWTLKQRDARANLPGDKETYPGLWYIGLNAARCNGDSDLASFL